MKVEGRLNRTGDGEDDLDSDAMASFIPGLTGCMGSLLSQLRRRVQSTTRQLPCIPLVTQIVHTCSASPSKDTYAREHGGQGINKRCNLREV